MRSKHNFKFGFENRRYYYNTRNKSGSGDFNFSPNQTALPGFINQTGHSFASFLLGDYGSTSRGIAASNFGHRWRTAGFYFQDDWKVNRKLTLNLGLRWEMVGGLIEVAGRMSGLDFDTPNPGAGNRPGALVFADDLGRRGFQDTYWKQISPKFGFAYAISDKLVMRGGYGINNTPPSRTASASVARSAITATSASRRQIHRSALRRTASGIWITAIPTSPARFRTRSRRSRMDRPSTTIPRAATACLMFRTGTSASSISCPHRRSWRSTTSATRVPA